jgi:hypothetical protein
MNGINEIAFLDVNEKRLIVCDQDLELKKVISRRGKGPGELVYPSACYVLNDLYYVRDGKEIEVFSSSGKNISTVSVPPDYAVVRFAVGPDGTIFTNSGIGNKKPLCAVDPDGRILFSFGTLYNQKGSKMQVVAGQARDLFSLGNDRIIGVGKNYPSFEVYDLQGKLLNSQLIDDPIISDDFEHVILEQSLDPSVTLDLFLDVFLYKNSVYFLSSLQKTNGTVRYFLIVGEVKSDKLIIRRHLEIISEDNDASWNDIYVLNESEVIIYELNTMAFHFFRINPLAHD